MATSPEALQLAQDMRMLSQSLQALIQSSSSVAASQVQGTDTTRVANIELTKFKKSITGGNKLTQEQTVLVKKAVDAKRAELAAAARLATAQQKHETLLRSANATQTELNASTAATVKLQQDLADATNNTNEATIEAKGSMKGFIKGLNVAGASLKWLSTTVVAQSKQISNQLNAGNRGFIEGSGGLVKALKDQQDQALKYGMSAADYAEVVMANRRVVNATGGTAQVTDRVTDSMGDLRTMTASQGEAFKVAAESMQALASSGIRPTSEALKGYVKDVKQLGLQTGMSQDQARAYYDEMAQDIDTVHMLRSAKEGERQAILENQRAYLSNNIAIGMSTTQAKEAAKQLNKIAGAKPLDRIRKAAKARMLGSALGVGGSEEAYRAMMSPIQTKEQQKLISDYLQQIASKMEGSRGSLGTEIMASTLLDKSGLESEVGKGSAFSTTTLKEMAVPVDELRKTHIETSEKALTQAMNTADLLIDQTKIIASGAHYAGVAAAGVTAIGSILIEMLGKMNGGGISMPDINLPGGNSPTGGPQNPTGGGWKGKLGKWGMAAAPWLAGAGAGYMGYESASTLFDDKATGIDKANSVAGLAIQGSLGTLGGIGGSIFGPAGTAKGAAYGAAAGGLLHKGASWAGGQLGGGLYSLFNKDVNAEMNAKDKAANEKRATAMPVPTKAAAGVATAATAIPLGSGSEFTTRAAAAAKLLEKDNAESVANTIAQVKSAAATAISTDLIQKSTTLSGEQLTLQIQKMDEGNVFLSRIAANTDLQVTLAEKSLLALTMTQEEREGKGDARSKLRSDNKIGAKYGYV